MHAVAYGVPGPESPPLLQDLAAFVRLQGVLTAQETMSAMISEEDVRTALSVEDDARPGHLAFELLAACAADSVSDLRDLIGKGADVRFQAPATGMSILMFAAQQSSPALVLLLLRRGAPWNAQDKEESSAGDYSAHRPEVCARGRWCTCCHMHTDAGSYARYPCCRQWSS